jgi:hypothetical protein
VVVVDGRPGEAFDSVTVPIAMSDEGSVVAYGARRGDARVVVVGDRKSRPYPDAGAPALSADGRTVAFPASDGAEWFVVRNDQEGPRFDWVGKPVLDLSGRRLAYAAESREPDGRYRFFVVADGRPGPAFDRVTTPAFSRDGRAAAYGASEDGRWMVVAGNRRIPAPGEVTEVFLSADGSRVGYVLRENNGLRVVGPRGAGATFDWIGWPAFSEDGRVVYLASRGKTKFLVSDRGTADLGESVVWDLTLSPEGKTAGFGARIGRGLWWRMLPVP